MSKELKEQYEKEKTFSAILYSEEDKAFILSSNYAEWLESKLKEAENGNIDLNIELDLLRAKLKEAEEQNKELNNYVRLASNLLSLVECPITGCDRNGTIPIQISEDDWETQECQWCAERNIILNQKP